MAIHYGTTRACHRLQELSDPWACLTLAMQYFTMTRAPARPSLRASFRSYLVFFSNVKAEGLVCFMADLCLR